MDLSMLPQPLQKPVDSQTILDLLSHKTWQLPARLFYLRFYGIFSAGAECPPAQFISQFVKHRFKYATKIMDRAYMEKSEDSQWKIAAVMKHSFYREVP